ncbi:ABC transporter substrate-binding protein [Roseburia sp. BX0805]|uniref:ABC transporter substrate-binding protein n=1 Tax=Roseburia yibonii TaxID=2763063 RepID=A0ABR7I7C2_9FIRM|nr:ABC transporter substrate-binding protein [Roseburia yibonii]MBC5752819.1 ABC transporter substrate-binding protein [Roseburia yibonii]
MKKKLLSTLMATAMVLGLVGCGNASSTQTASGSASSTEAGTDGKVYHIGVCQLVEHEALDAATQGFQDALKDKLGENNVVFDVQNAQGEETNCATICTGFVSDNVDLILANATASLQAASAATNSIPIVGTSITDYATALNADDWNGTSGTNITGTSDLAPLDQQEAMIKELVPDVTQVGIVYCSAEANSVFQANQIEAALEKDGIAYKEYSAADSNEIQSVVTKAVSECDCLYVPTDNTMAANVDIIKNVTVPAGIPVIAGEEGICQGALATLSISYYDIGQAAGEMAYEILVNGKDPGTMEIEYASATTKEYNADVADALGITIPDDYVKLSTEE